MPSDSRLTTSERKYGLVIKLSVISLIDTLTPRLRALQDQGLVPSQCAAI
jgi:hypothetical protein